MTISFTKLLADHRHVIDAIEPDTVIRIAGFITHNLRFGDRVFICGNGGSAADAQHFAAEMVGRFKDDSRRPLPVIALTTDTSILTAVANDFGYDLIFVRQLMALSRKGDVLIALSTSGRSQSILKAIQYARDAGLRTGVLSSRKAPELRHWADELFLADSDDTARIQEAHEFVLHCVCEYVDEAIS